MDDINKETAPSLSPKDWVIETVEEHLHCVLCGSELEFRHKTDFVGLTVIEDAHCPACRVRNRQTTHRLQ